VIGRRALAALPFATPALAQEAWPTRSLTAKDPHALLVL
jgi:hypothetical protein